MPAARIHLIANGAGICAVAIIFSGVIGRTGLAAPSSDVAWGEGCESFTASVPADPAGSPLGGDEPRSRARSGAGVSGACFRVLIPPDRSFREVSGVDGTGVGGASPAEFVREGSLRGRRFLVFRADAAEPSAASFRVVLSPSATPRPFPPAEPFDSLLDRAVINPADRARFYPAPGRRGTEETTEYLIVTSEALREQFSGFADWKTARSVPAGVVTVEEIAAAYAGSDAQEKIKACVTDYAAERGTVWVLLGGDDTVVPDRDCYCLYDVWNGSTDIPTDLYYAGLDDLDWNDDGDAYPCEPASYGDTVDLDPDVFVGRAPVRTVSEAAAFIAKSQAYAADPPLSGFAEEMLLVGVELFNAWDGHSDADWRSETMYANFISPHWPGVRYRLYDTATDFSGGSAYDVTRSNLAFQISSGYNFIFEVSSGSALAWMLEGGSYFSTGNVSLCSNAGAEGLIYSDSPQAAGFDLPSDPSLGEEFLRNAGGGAAAFIGPSRAAIDNDQADDGHGVSFEYAREFWRILFSGEPVSAPRRLGAVFAEHLLFWNGLASNHGGARYYQFGLSLLGDPEMELMVRDPITPTPTPTPEGYLTPTSPPPSPTRTPSPSPTPEGFRTPTPSPSPSPSTSPTATPEGMVCARVLDFSTYLGGGGSDWGYEAACDPAGGIVLAGLSASADFPATGGAGFAGARDVFVARLSSDGSALLSGTLVGGASYETTCALALGPGGEACVFGQTSSTDFPTVNPCQASFGGGSSDLYLFALSPGGSALLFSTYLGGSEREFGEGLALDSSGSPFLGGYSFSIDFPTRQAYQASHGGEIGLYGDSDIVLSRLSSSGSALLYSTYLGGENLDQCHAVAIGPDGSLYLCGETSSNDMPTVNPYQAFKADTDGIGAYLARLSSSGSALIFATYFGGAESDEEGVGAAVDGSGCFYVAGITRAPDLPTANPYQASNASDLSGGLPLPEGFVFKLGPSGSDLIYSTYLGAERTDGAGALALDEFGRAYLAGYTYSTAFPTRDPWQGSRAGNYDAFLAVLSPSGSALEYSTYLGGSGEDRAEGLSRGADGRLVLAGYTKSQDFPTRNALQGEWNPGTTASNYDAFLAGFRTVCQAPVSPTPPGWLTPTPPPEVPGSPTPSPNLAPPPTPVATPSLPSPSPAPSSPPAPSPTPTPPPSMTPTPAPSSSPTPAPSKTPTPEPSRSPSPAPSPVKTSTPFYLLAVSGAVRDAATFAPLSGAMVRFYAENESHPDCPPLIAWTDGAGGCAGEVRTVIPEGRVILEARRYEHAPSASAAEYAGSTDVSLPVLSLSGIPRTAPGGTDFDGDGRRDDAVYRPASGLWAVRGLSRFCFGTAGDEPVTGDFDGDGTDDPGVFRPSDGLWAVRSLTRFYYGGFLDLPVPGDYEGRGRAAGAVFRAAGGIWAVRGAARLFIGGSGEAPATDDFDGDGRRDPAVFRPSDGLWSIPSLTRFVLGGAGDELVLGDADGDGSADAGLFRPASSLWAIRSLTRYYFGSSGDLPVPSDRDGDLAADPALFRPSAGLWAVRSRTRFLFGASGDLPLSR